MNNANQIRKINSITTLMKEFKCWIESAEKQFETDHALYHLFITIALRGRLKFNRIPSHFQCQLTTFAMEMIAK